MSFLLKRITNTAYFCPDGAAFSPNLVISPSNKPLPLRLQSFGGRTRGMASIFHKPTRATQRAIATLFTCQGETLSILKVTLASTLFVRKKGHRMFTKDNCFKQIRPFKVEDEFDTLMTPFFFATRCPLVEGLSSSVGNIAIYEKV